MSTKKTILITGGSKGIGFGMAQVLVEAGNRVAITSRSQEAAERAADELRRSGPAEVLPLKADVRSLADQERAVAELLQKWGQLDVLIANAGLGHFAPIDQLEPERWKAVIDTNLTGVYYSLRACLEALKKSKGYFITISSLAGTNFFPNGSAYSASKFGLTGFTQSVMLDLRPYGIKTTTIMPGSVKSFFNEHVPTEEDSWKIQPEDLGQMVLDLLKMPDRTLPSKIEVRPAQPPQK